MIALRRSLSLSPSVRYFSHAAGRAESCAVRINECSARDGLQSIKQIIPTKTKVELLHRLSKTGLQHIEATSFVSPKWVPQLADATEVMDAIRPISQKGDIRLPVLTPNMKGLDNAIKSGAGDIVVFTSATEGFAKANLNTTVEQSLLNAEAVANAALKQNINVIGSVSCIFADPYTGPTSPEDVRRVAQRLLDAGCSEVVLGDTLGLGTPQDTERLLSYLLQTIPAERLTGHFHDTYGQAVANVRKSYEMGLRSFDCSVAGLGGCPFAPGARGNVATEDVVYMFEKAGIKTGIDFDSLCETGEWISEQLGVDYGSRAGFALRQKHRSVVKQHAATATATRETQRPLRSFEVIEDTGEYSVSRNGTTLKVTLNRPKNGNALTGKMIDGLTRLFKRLEDDHSVFHVLLCSQGKFFCTGMDLSKDMEQDRSEDPDALYAKSLELYDAIDKAAQTTIAVIDGHSFGGGVGLGFICDIRLVSKDARWTLSEVKLGVTPAIISKYIVREWGPAFAREAILTGREVSAAELQSIGAVHGIADDSHDLSHMVEKKLVDLQKCAPQAASICKRLVRAGWKDPEGDRQEKLIRDTFVTMMLPGSEGSHGISQFQQKVKAVDWAAFWAKRPF